MKKRQLVERTERLDIRDLRRRGIVKTGMTRLRIRLSTGDDPVIHIEWRPMPFGGARPFFLCFDCLERREVLYVTPHIACSHCQDLAYRSENLSRFQRKQQHLWKLRAMIGADYSGPLPPKPHRMGESTYDSLLLKIDKAEAAVTAAWLRMAGRR